VLFSLKDQSFPLSHFSDVGLGLLVFGTYRLLLLQRNGLEKGKLGRNPNSNHDIVRRLSYNSSRVGISSTENFNDLLMMLDKLSEM